MKRAFTLIELLVVIAITVITLPEPPRALPAENSQEVKESIGRVLKVMGDEQER